MVRFLIFHIIFTYIHISVSVVDLGLNEAEMNQSRFLLTRNEKGELEVIDLLSQNVTVYAKENDVTFHLYTRNNVDDDEVLTVDYFASSEYFDPNRRTLVLIHGWKNDYQSEMPKLIKNTVLEYFNLNVLAVDWSYAAKRNYITARLSVSSVGKAVAKFLSNLANEFLIDMKNFSLIGHSLGAHIAGNAGAALDSKLAYIVGLDPAGPLFCLKHTENRLDSTDANYVEAIHTSILLGFDYSLGHSDFYPNGGHRQPGCGFDLDNECAHSRSYQYYAESLKTRFLGYHCSNYLDFLAGRCDHNETAIMGRFNVDTEARGIYYLKTDKEESSTMNV